MFLMISLLKVNVRKKNYPEDKQNGEMLMLGVGALMLSESLKERKFVFQP